VTLRGRGGWSAIGLTLKGKKVRGKIERQEGSVESSQNSGGKERPSPGPKGKKQAAGKERGGQQ